MTSATLPPSLHVSEQDLAEIGPIDFEENELSYRIHKNIVVLRSGMCLKNGILLKDSMYNIPRLYFRFVKRAYGSWLIRGTEKADPEKTYLVIHTPWSSGYYHWITESLARLRPVMHLIERATALLPSNTSLGDVMVRSLACFGVRDVEFFPPTRNVFARNLILPQMPPRHMEMSRADVKFVRERVVDTVGTGVSGRDTPEKVYISRARSRGRRIVNEEEVSEFLAARGYSRVFAEDLGFAEQVRLMQGARIVLSPHGAGLTNLIFMRPGSSVVELFRRAPGDENWDWVLETRRLNPAYPRLATTAGIHYYCLMCVAADRRQNFFQGDMLVDIPGLEEKLCEAERNG